MQAADNNKHQSDSLQFERAPAFSRSVVDLNGCSSGYADVSMSHTHSSHTSTNMLWSLVVCSVSALGQSFHATFPPILQTSATNPSFWTSVKTHVYIHRPINVFAAVCAVADLSFSHARAGFFFLFLQMRHVCPVASWWYGDAAHWA